MIEKEKLLHMLLQTCKLLLESGAETYRAEETALYISRSLSDYEVSVFVILTGVTVDIYDGKEHCSGTLSVLRRSYSFSRIERINRISRALCDKTLTWEQAQLQIDSMCYEKERRFYLSELLAGCAAAMFALLLGGGLREAAAAFGVCALAQYLTSFFRNIRMFVFLQSFLGGFLPALLLRFIPGCDPQLALTAAMLPLFPGVAMMHAIRDMINGDLISGVSRTAEAAIVALGLAVGVILA